MKNTLILFIALTLFMTASMAKVFGPPITELTKITPLAEVLKSPKPTPSIMTTKEHLEKYFDKDNQKLILEKINFDHQIVLLYAWSGSGGDKIEYSVMESMPEQIAFTYTRGRTRDLRQHVKIFIIRKNVKFKMK